MYFFCIFICSTIFMSTLHLSKDLVVHHQEFIVVYCITQFCTVHYDKLLMMNDKIFRNM